VLPNEKHEFSMGWRAVKKGGPAGCTTERVCELHISWAAEKDRLPYSAARRPAFLLSV